MLINKLNLYDKINFQSNINFIPIKNREDAKRMAQLCTSLREYSTFGNFIGKIMKAYDYYKAEAIYCDTIKNAPQHHIELVESNNKVIGAYSLKYWENIPVASVDFMVEAPHIRKKKISKDFLLAIAERIYNIAISNNIKFIRWSADSRNKLASNLYQKRIKNVGTQIDLQNNSVIYTVDIDAFKNSIDEYKLCRF